MDFTDIASAIGKYAPVLGAALSPLTGGTSALIGAGIGALTKAFGLSESATSEEILKTIQADPEANLKLIAAESDYKLKMRDFDIQELKAQLADVQSARSRQIEHEKATGESDTNLYALAWVLVLGFLILIGFLLKVPVPEDQNGVLFMLFGALAAGFGQVLSFFFGSSKSSETKTDMIYNSTPNIPKKAV